SINSRSARWASWVTPIGWTLRRSSSPSATKNGGNPGNGVAAIWVLQILPFVASLFRCELEQLACPGRVGIGIAGAAVGEHINRAVRSDPYVADASIHIRQQGFLVGDLVVTDFQSVEGLPAQGAAQQAIFPLRKQISLVESEP